LYEPNDSTSEGITKAIMQVELEGIKFNYDPDVKKTGAFNLRRNETLIVRVPEWQPDVPPIFEASPVAYALSIVPEQMGIHASFNCKIPGLTIQAIADPPDHILGNVQAKEFPNTGSSGFVLLNLPQNKVATADVGIYDITWHWQYSTQPGVWTDFQTTYHRVYIVLALPMEPWEPKSRKPSNIHQPWTAVLDYACDWARGVKKNEFDQAARRVNEEVHMKGNRLVKHSSEAFYGQAKFECTKLLNLLKTGMGEQKWNCEDCATIVSTFANILGTELWQSSMGDTFKTNPVLQIGDENCDENWNSTIFLQHTVAWKGDCLEPDILFDSFLQVDGEGQPDSPPRIALLPSQIAFGVSPDMSYRFRLVKAGNFCIPTPRDGRYPRQRRPLGTSYFGAAKVNPKFIPVLKTIYDFTAWPSASDLEHVREINRGLLVSLFPVARLHSYEELNDENFQLIIKALFQLDNSDGTRFLSLNLYVNRIENKINDLFLQILAAFNQLTMKRLEDSKIGELAFGDAGLPTILFRRGPFIALVASAGRTDISVENFARILDQFLTPIELNPNLNIQEEKMDHPLAHRWRCFTVSLGDPPQFVNRGIVDLRTLNPETGILTLGAIEPPSGPVVPISGRVIEFNGVTSIRLDRTDGNAYYLGSLTFKKGSELIITGHKIRGGESARETDNKTDDEILLTQVEEPWIITKP
jgi:hypothetical protein